MAYVVQAIVTKFIGPTNTLGARIKAKASAGSVTMPWDHSFSIEANHAKAAQTLADKLEWSGKWFQGGMPDDTGYVFVSAARDSLSAFSAAFETLGKH